MKCTIDSRELEVNEGESVLQAAKRFGIEIPHFCYHAKLSVAGSCRLCLVKVNNLPKLMPACNVIITPNMVIETQAEEVQRARRQVMQFIMLNHPVDCGICDKAGECTLQNYQQDYGAPQAISIDPKIRRRKLHELSPRISLDNERCILCSRCVRFTKEISGSAALGIVDRGGHSHVDRIGALPFDDPYSDNVIDICPTGALLSSEFLYKSRVWFLEPVRSVCTGCARGCSVQVWRRQKHREPRAPGMAQPNVAYRVTAFDNPQINGPWLCNKGFDLHKAMAQPRVLAARVAGAEVPVDQALDAAHALLVAARNPAALLSAQASNEELDAFAAAFGTRLRVYAKQDDRPAEGEVVEDRFLIRADKNPNSFGVQAKFGAAPFDAAAGHDVVLVWGALDDPALLGAAKRVHLAAFEAPTLAAADVVIPISTTFERSGSFSNFEGTRNDFTAVFDKPQTVQHAANVLARIAS